MDPITPEAARKLLMLDWTQVSVLVGALVLGVSALIYVIVAGGKKREEKCQQLNALVQNKLIDVLEVEVQKGQAALDRASTAIENNTKSSDETRRTLGLLFDRLNRA